MARIKSVADPSLSLALTPKTDIWVKPDGSEHLWIEDHWEAIPVALTPEGNITPIDEDNGIEGGKGGEVSEETTQEVETLLEDDNSPSDLDYDPPSEHDGETIEDGQEETGDDIQEISPDNE